MSWRQLLMNCVALHFRSVLWLVAPSSLPTTPPSFLSLSLSVRQNDVHGFARSLACSRNCDLCLVSSRLALSGIEVVVVVHNRSTYLSFFSPRSKVRLKHLCPSPPLLSFLPAPSVLFLCILRRRKKKLVLCCALLVVVCARVVAVVHMWRVGFQGRECYWERESASEPQNALSASFVLRAWKFFMN